MQPISRETIVDRRQPQIRWSAIFAGAVLSFGLWMLLQILGMGLGLAAVDTDDAGSLKGVGIGTGIWSILAALIALFIGGYLAGRLAGTRARSVGAMHASVMWALAMAIGLWGMYSLITGIVGNVTRLGGAAVNATSQVVSGAASAGADKGDDLMQALGVDSNDLLGPVNERLDRQGKPRVTARELNNVMKGAAQRGLREGKLDKQVLTEELARHTRLDRADAQDIANQFGNQYQDIATRVSTTVDQAGEKAKDVALEAADKTGKALAVGGLMMLLSLGAALAGGALGAHRHNVRKGHGPGGTRVGHVDVTTTRVDPAPGVMVGGRDDFGARDDFDRTPGMNRPLGTP